MYHHYVAHIQQVKIRLCILMVQPYTNTGTQYPVSYIICLWYLQNFTYSVQWIFETTERLYSVITRDVSYKFA